MVCSAAARMWPAVTRTVQPSHHEASDHWSDPSPSHVSAMPARSAWIWDQISSVFTVGQLLVGGGPDGPAARRGSSVGDGSGHSVGPRVAADGDDGKAVEVVVPSAGVVGDRVRRQATVGEADGGAVVVG